MDKEWIKNVQDDPWLDEALYILADMTHGEPESNLVHDQKP
jgi:hypothetical protein